MRLYKKIIVMLIVCFITISITLAQQPEKQATENEYHLVNWNSENGLIYGRVNCMLKDKNGFLWIGTEKALNRFDGSIFKNYLDPKSKNQKIAGNFINSLIEDSLHNIWIGTDKGLSRYDIKADTFKSFFSAIASASSSASIVPFWATSTEVLCVESDSIITSYNIHSLVKRMMVRLSQKIGRKGYIPFCIFEAGANCIWALPMNREGGLIQVSILNGKSKIYNWADRNHKDQSHFSEGMCFDRKRNVIWMNTEGGFMQFTLADKQFHNINSVNEFFNRGVGIGIDTKNRVWVGTGNKGIIIYDPATRAVTLPFAGDTVLQHKANDANYRIYCDRDGIIWIGYWVSAGWGINQLIPFSKVSQRYPGNAGQSSSFKSSYGYLVEKGFDGKIWIFGNDLYIFNPNNGLFTVLGKKDLPALKNDKSVTFLTMSKTSDKVWLRGDQTGGLFELNVASKQCHAIKIKDTANRQIIHVDLEEPGNTNKNSIIFFGRIRGSKQAIFILNPDSLIARQLPGLLPENITDVETDGDQLFFLRRRGLTTNLTYTLVKGRLIPRHTPVDTIGWNHVVFNSEDSTWWVGAFMQLVHYDKNFRLIRRYTQADGVPVINVSGVQPDNDGNIWFNTERNISRLNPRTGNIITLSEKEGWQQQPYHGGPVVKDDAGDLYFFGFDGLDRIKPYNLKMVYPPSSIYLKSLEIGQNATPLLTGVNYLQHLSLKYFENKLAIETGIIDYYSKGTSRMRYKLEEEGMNENWQYGPTNYTIRFEGLQPGKYKLTMQASNAALQFNGPEKILVINIVPAFWDQWWFRIIILAIAALIIISIFRTRVRKIKEDAFIQNQLKEMEMKALKAQMNPHFIYNALNSIQALVANDKKDEGIRYIGSFSRLLRQVLDNSENNVISLDKELETIGLYIQLESLRLDVQLQYKKIIPENIVPEFEKIPPLILQPFVENALWHGLSRKAGDKEIKITVSLNADWLICDIQDNGIGREKAREWKNNSAAIHQSKGLDITRKRLIDFNENELVTPIEFFDLYDDKNPAGTLVTVRIKRKFNSISV